MARQADSHASSLSLSPALSFWLSHADKNMMDRQNVVVFDICVGFGPEMLFGNSSVQFFGQARGKNFSEICKQARLESIYLLGKLNLLL